MGTGCNLLCAELENIALDDLATSYILNKSIYLPENISFFTTSQMTFKQYFPQYYRAAATNAEPYDIWHEIHALKQSGIKPICLNSGSGINKVIENIFGSGHFETLEQLTRLPEIMS